MTNDAADHLALKVLDIEKQRTALKYKYYDRLKSVVGPMTATRFLMLENQIERVVDLQIASELPFFNGPEK